MEMRLKPIENKQVLETYQTFVIGDPMNKVHMGKISHLSIMLTLKLIRINFAPSGGV